MVKNKITKVQKRDGNIVGFDQTRITDAIFKAITATGQGDGKRSKRISDRVVKILNRRFKKDEVPHVEQIQDIVEEVLILEGLVETARAYILYREQRRRIREAVAVVDESTEMIDRYIQELDWQVYENANMTFSLQGLNQYTVKEISKKYWLNKIYPKEIREAAINEDFHIHNLEILAPYTFFGMEVIISKLNGRIKLISLKDLYEEILCPEILLNEKDIAFAKYPENLYVLDRKGWTKVFRMVRKKKEREMRFIKSEQGRSVIVTDNHPFIIKRNQVEKEIEAKNVREKDDLIFSVSVPSLLKTENLFSKKYLYLAEELIEKGHQNFFLEGFEWQDFIKNWGGSLRAEGTLSASNSANSLNNKLELTEDLGYLVGIFIAEGNYNSWRLSIDNSDNDILNKIQRICSKLGIRSYIREKTENDKVISIKCSTLKLLFEKVFQIKPGSKNKNLPVDILNYNLDFIRGVIAGIIDGDGSVDAKDRVNNSSQILIRVSSRTMVEQIAYLLQFFGIIVRDMVSTKDIGKKNIFKGKEIVQNHPIYGIVFSKKEGIDFPSFKYQRAKVAKKHWRTEKYDWNKVLNNEFTTITDNVIYDITTDSGTFLCNGLLVHNCMGWDLYDLLLRGFGGVPGKLECRPAKHFRTALGQLVNFLYTLQGETAGANAVSNFDTLLAPFIRYDNLNYPHVKQAMQEFLYNCMVPTRVGFQTPFLNVSLDIKVPEFYKNQPVIVGGKPQKETYGEFQEEMNMFIRAFYEGLMEGDAKGRPLTFPIPTVSITKDFNWDDSNLNPLWEATAKYGVNYFSNFIQSDMKPEDARSMCLDAKEEILIRNSKKIKRLPIKEVAENYKLGDFDKEGWADCKKEGDLKVLSLNPQSLKLEWTPVKRFLKIVDDKETEITTEDGKKATFSLKHPMAVYTPEGIKMKFAKDIKEGDYLLTLKKADGEIFSKKYQKIGSFILNEDLAKILGYFTAEGNYLFESTNGYTHFGEPKGLQFSFKREDLQNLNLIKSLIRKTLSLKTKEKQDQLYNNYYLFVYNSEISRKLYQAGFRKYGRLPQILFNSPKSVIEAFLEFYLRGQCYKKRKEIHLNDLELSRDLVLLFSLLGKPLTYKLRKKNQIIYLQHTKLEVKKGNDWINNPILAERVPGQMVLSTAKAPELVKSRTVGLKTLEKYNAYTFQSLKIKNSDIYLVRVKEAKVKNYQKLKEFYDIELQENHLFIHSLGQVSFNCCRLRLDNRELYKRGGGLFGSNPLTGSIGVVTINMPRIGYLSKTKKEFFERLEHLMDLAKESLEIKRKALEDFMDKGLYPYSKYYLSSVKKLRNSYFGNHFSTVGLIGMNEALLNFIGENIISKRGRKFALEVLDFMREKLVEYQRETGNMYNLEATPGEGTAYRQARIDKEKYPDIITAGTKEVPYYTNSSHLPVNFTDDVFEALKLQDELQTKYTGGTVLHLFLGERISDPKAAKSLVKKVFENFHLPYITLTPTFSICPSHGYLEGEYFECPKCTIKQPCEVYSRIVGYLRPVQQWNLGKKEEFKQRKEYRIYGDIKLTTLPKERILGSTKK